MIFLFTTSKVFSYACIDGYYCTHNNQFYDGWYSTGDHPLRNCWALSNIRDPYYYTCDGTDSNCSGGGTYYPNEEMCNLEINAKFWGCCLKESCDGCNCTPPSCGGDYPLTSCPDGHTCSTTTKTCTKVDSCGDPCGGTNTRTCYKDNGPSCTTVECPGRCSSSYDCQWVEWDYNSCDFDSCEAAASGGAAKYPDDYSYRQSCCECLDCNTTCPIGYNKGSCPLGSTCDYADATCDKQYSDGSGTCGSKRDEDACYKVNCVPGCDVTCPPLTSTSFNNFGFVNRTCTDDCGDTESDRCYCTTECNPDSCPLAYSTTNLGFGSFMYDDCTNFCDDYNSRTCYCRQCTPAACFINTSEGGTHGYFDTKTCWNDCGIRNDRDCYCNSACTPNFCPAGTSEGGTHGFFDTYDCTNACGEPQDRDCYCNSACTPESCSAEQDEEKVGGVLYGNNDLKTCENDCDESDSRDCWWICNRATCTNLHDNWGFELELTDNCDSPPCEQLNEVTIPIAPATVHPGCPTEEVKTCYYPNSDPTLLSIDVREMDPDNQDVSYSYSTNSYSGTKLNNQVKLIANYEDTDGVNDMEALYVWWSTSSAKNFITPTLLDESGSTSGITENNSNFGIMIRRNSEGAWGDVYIPHIIDADSDNYWTYSGITTDPVAIKGSSGEDMIVVNGINVTENIATDIINLEMNVVFETDSELANNGLYNLWGSVNDRVGFDPFDDNVIRKSTWLDSGENWNVDLILPNANNFTISFEDENTIKIDLSANNNTDGMDISTVRLDACISGTDTWEKLGVEGEDYTLQSCGIGFNENETLINMSRGDLGANDSLLLDKSTLVAGTTNFSITPLIGLNGNDSGAISFFLSVMDYAGNFDQSEAEILKLGDWAFVKDALVYGNTGTRSESRELEPDQWADGPLSEPEYLSEKADLTNHALLGGSGVNIYNELRSLARYGVNSSFKAVEFNGLTNKNVFDNLVEAYSVKSNNTNFGVYPIETASIDGTLTNLTDVNPADQCAETFCILERTGALTINSGFQCDGMGLIVVDGDLIINPEFTNATENDACIILASGNIQITQGDPVPGSPGYDIIEAFLISQKKIIIDADATGNGLYVQGGLVALENVGLSEGSIENNRDVPFPLNNINPVIAVKGMYKYGQLSKSLFGSQVDIFKTELGFKPY